VLTDHIEVILFDMGGTLRGSIPKDETSKISAMSRIIDLLGAEAAPGEFAALLTTRAGAYHSWARETVTELNEQDLWTKWMLPEWPAEKIGELAISLNQLWREATGERIIFPETKEVILTLFRRGYRLGLVSNTTSSVEVPQALRAMELSGCIETVILSCVVGMRKPDPSILLEATRRMGVQPEKCAYIGDRLNRDVEASREAGFPISIILCDPKTFTAHTAEYPNLIPDQTIDNLKELLEIFPDRRSKTTFPPAMKASLSTMWVKTNFPDLSTFYEAARRSGFAAIELNHQMDSAMLAGIDLADAMVSSVHEPCPADVSTETLKNRDWLISSPDEGNRRRGVEAIQRSIDLAHEIGVPMIVVHCGMTSPDMTLEKRMRGLFEEGKIESEEYHVLKQKLIDARAGMIGPCFEAVKKSLGELLEHARQYSIRLGLENRFHYFDIPNLDEMAELLALGTHDQIGFTYDVGHAQTLDRLGFYPHEEWLRRFSSRMICVHLHDVAGVTDHLAPGLGDVDFEMVKSYLPADAIRTFELHMTNSPEQVKLGLQSLVEIGCVKPV